MDREEFLKRLNRYAFDGEINAVIEGMNVLIESEDYKDNLDLIFMAIATTQMYGFLSYLTQEERTLFFECDYYRSSSYRGIEIPFYNRGQLSFLYELENNQKVFFSAPTSFGKTSIVSEYILNNYIELNNIVFIVPTNSLLEELFEKFTQYNSRLGLGYSITTMPSNALKGRNLLFLTPERFITMAENDILNEFDLIVMDETYKIVDGDDERISDFVNHRSLRFRKVADLVAKANARVIFLSPFTYTLTKSMQAFLDKYNIVKVDRTLEYVNREVIRLANSDDAKKYFGRKVKNYTKDSSIAKKVNLILANLPKERSIVYVANYSKAYEVAEKLDFITNFPEKTARFDAFIRHIKENFLVEGKDSWAVYEALKKGVGIYISPLPRYIKKEITKLYENKELSTLIVTSAFTEGVNTGASNLIFTSLVNGPTTNKLSEIDVLNASGRAGRFAKKPIGRIYCISGQVYNQVEALQRKNDIELENYNYKMIESRLDYEVEMIDEKYLNKEQKERLKLQSEEIQRLGLDEKDMNISLNVSNEWKLILYNHFTSCSKEKIKDINQAIRDIYEQEEGKRISSLEVIFNDINDAFCSTGIDVFPRDSYEIGPFDKAGNFTWGRFYGIYVSGTPKKIIANNIVFITGKYAEITGNRTFESKNAVEHYFKENDASWVLDYYKTDLSLNMNKFYSETFKIVSNIIQYKIPFYLSFYVSVFALFVEKHKLNSEFEGVYDIERIISIFEDGETDEEYNKLIDYGLPITTVKKMSEANIKIEDIKCNEYAKNNFDDYENIIIEEIAKLL